MSQSSDQDIELDSILDLAGFQIFPASANQNRLAAKGLLLAWRATAIADAEREARIEQTELFYWLIKEKNHQSIPDFAVDAFNQLMDELRTQAAKPEQEADYDVIYKGA